MKPGFSLSLQAWFVFTAASLFFCSNASAAAPKRLLLAGAWAGSDVIVVGERATILRSSDQASTWESASVPAAFSATLTGVSFAPGSSRGWAVGHDGLILSTTDGGRSWQKSWQSENVSESFLDVLALDARHVLAVGAYGLCLETTDAGETWTRRKLIDDDRHLNRLSRGSPDALYVAGERGALLRSRDRGVTWTALSSPYEGSFYGILPVGESSLVAYGLRGHIFFSADDGRSWTQSTIALRSLIAAAIQLKDSTLVLAGPPRSLGLSQDLGRTVSLRNVPSLSAVSALLELSDRRILALGEAGVTILPQP